LDVDDVFKEIDVLAAVDKLVVYGVDVVVDDDAVNDKLSMDKSSFFKSCLISYSTSRLCASDKSLKTVGSR
jgi:hypothetical protein